MGSSPKWNRRSTIVFYFDFFYRIPLHKNPGKQAEIFSSASVKTLFKFGLCIWKQLLWQNFILYLKSENPKPYKRSLHFCKVSLQK
jgi:hypothetical protein